MHTAQCIHSARTHTHTQGESTGDNYVISKSYMYGIENGHDHDDDTSCCTKEEKQKILTYAHVLCFVYVVK